ncbi:MAG: CRISPR system precrRNA processing endoribonuclease RAMP protein Cas6 [Sphingomonadaceae bacterium]|uniref:CRISPR system precrRNA processing endoribonuclease RAMP protein Cas6 n=1 Tax=Thermaurantiacus sp. TaxID=2820283 RepID=UPI00298EF255|nr:CRISPR system precrRNA processing endoribonuclease RAMP protein Cas6 [Thermaurantiacus sp.]MCS6987683.1 CRISPR system precrRNA processing endoribonuclease RAMP protein Cas6 [Sphingomonadaceae bacterium]MDW8415907.1 CRISPR system precrRNA processing endoribonuclease RAMP protein Cas6 [Thermaurantiacus sp.]
MILARSPFPILDLELEVELFDPLALPPFAGGLLRGAFGAALRRLACMTGFRTCAGCPLIATCPHRALFEPPARDLAAVGLPRAHDGLPPPFILRVPAEDPGPDGRLVFGMRLVGSAIDRLAYVIEAWRRVFRRGLGPERVRGRLVGVRDARTGAPLWDGDTMTWPEVVHPPLPSGEGRFVLVSRTPIRLGRQGGPLRSAPKPRAFVAAIVRRARLLALHAGPQEREEVRSWPVADWLSAAERVDDRPGLVWRDWWRFSSRQKRSMNLGGLVGRWEWEGVPPAVHALLAMGELLHVGKDASFGLGAYEIRRLGA